MITRVQLGGGGTALRTAWFERGPADAEYTLLCLHPLGHDSRFFLAFAEALGPAFHVIGFDQRGHGEAWDQPARDLSQMVDDAQAALDRLGRPVHVLGHSMGGAVAAELSARVPGVLLTLSVIASPARGLPIFAERAIAAQAQSLASIIEPTLCRWFGQSNGLPEIEAARAALLKMSPEGFDAAWRALASFKGFEPIARRMPPTLAIGFTEDLSTPPPVMDEIARAIRSAGQRVHRLDIAGAGHMGMMQKPAEVADAVRHWILKTTGTTPSTF